MNHSALKKFAAKARVDLIEQVGARLQYVLNSDSVELREKASQVKQLREALKQESETALVERVAYLWFNRLAALRFMDAEGRHPFGCRVVTATEGNTQPELLQQARNGSLPDALKLDVQRMNDLLDGRVPSSNAQAEVYRMLVVAVCNFYHQLMPFVFEKIADYTELLLPEDLLSEASVAEGFRSAVEDADCAEVELIGWLYQYYIAEKKDAVMARKKAVPKEDIPAVTQLFTPHWIVRYMVENSLGRLWMQSRPSSRLVEKMDYYIPDAEGNEPDPEQLTVSSPEEIRLIDPACGSGHILTYAFDLLYAIYEEEGYEPSSIPGHILTKNLHGVEIDERAAELAYFALMMKAQQRYGRFLRRQLRAEPSERIVPEICCLEEIHFEEGELKAYMDALDLGELFTAPVLTLMHQFEEAKNFGSLIQPVVNDVAFLREAIEGKDLGGELFIRETHRKVETVLRQAEILRQRYQCAVLNPPYMNKFNGTLKTLVEEKFEDYKSDLFAAFVVRSKAMTVDGGLLGFMTPFVWMFISSYEKLRSKILDSSTLTSLTQLEYSGFDGATVPICTFTLQNLHRPSYKGGFINLASFKGHKNQSPKALEAIKNPTCGWFYRASAFDFKSIPQSPIAFWLSEKMLRLFSAAEQLGDRHTAITGLSTTNSDMFLRLWHEVDYSNVELNCKNAEECADSGIKWFPINKGGNSRKWYGNNDTVLNWEKNGLELKNYLTEKYNGGSYTKDIRGEHSYFRSAVAASAITSNVNGFRFYPEGALFDVNFRSFIPEDFHDRNFLLVFLNSILVRYLLKALCPTLALNAADLLRLPLVSDYTTDDAAVERLIDISKVDWDASEESWDFKTLPLISNAKSYNSSIEQIFSDFRSKCAGEAQEMKFLEEKCNKALIDAYGLSSELSAEIPLEDITLTTNPYYRHGVDLSPGELELKIKQENAIKIISYAVGCMLGRYSLDKPGLILANAGETIEDYLKQVPEPQFMPDADNIIPVLDGEWFEDDIVARFREFLKVTFGEDTLRENIQFIEESLGKELRKYFVTDFYSDHLKTYKKRPIYWLFQSPKKSFQALIYLHRYDRDTVNLLLNDYLREFQNKLQNRRKHLDEILASESTSARDKTAATKEQAKIDKALPELADWERDVILPLAQQRLEIDLDDGVKQNYPKFGNALAKIPGVS
jgi:type II restriction/modification system DNA methylase subunit YeeA